MASQNVLDISELYVYFKVYPFWYSYLQYNLLFLTEERKMILELYDFWQDLRRVSPRELCRPCRWTCRSSVSLSSSHSSSLSDSHDRCTGKQWVVIKVNQIEILIFWGLSITLLLHIFVSFRPPPVLRFFLQVFFFTKVS